NVQKLVALYQAFEFRSLLKKLPMEQATVGGDVETVYELITTPEAFGALAKRLAAHKMWAFDFETTGTDPLTARPVGVSFSYESGKAFYVAFASPGADLFAGRSDSRDTSVDGLEARECLRALKDLFEDASIRKIGQNIKYEMLVLAQFDIELRGIWFDTMVASYVLNPAKPNHNLDDIALEHLGMRLTPITDLIGSGKNQLTMDQVDLQKVYRYGCQDSDVTFRLAKVLGNKMIERDLAGLFDEMEMPLVPVLGRMEAVGVAVDPKLLERLSGEMQKSLAALTTTIHTQAGAEFNINSPKQLAEILFEKLGLPVVKKTKTGASTDVEVLEQLSEQHPLPRDILKFRELSKLKNTYVDALPQLVNKTTGRVHTSFNQTVTATGRLSSSDPNLQNIPVRKEEGRKIRCAFIAGFKGHVLVSADYSQIELRVLAHLSRDEQLIKAFNQGADIHRYTASLIFNQTLDAVTDSMRESAKTVNFGVLYGMQAFSLAKTLGITHEAARDFIKAYFDRYPSVKQYLDQTVEKARRDGYVSTFFKRRRYIPEILSKDVRARNFAERTAINAPIQGTASDIIKKAMIEIDEQLRQHGLAAKMILQVHDELVFEVSKKELGPAIEMIGGRMRGAVKFDVPM
ncbi:MAG: DNA polymerase I, partial [Candidatus Omnitrophota bacterium]